MSGHRDGTHKVVSVPLADGSSPGGAPLAAITTVGFSACVVGLSWIDDVMGN